ncbi:hypothetical protein RHO14_07890 [Orbus wheelerorum]|uniref:hypothetical protein n=1 Tax=Orbus wheelerorum TaxID=3074111 RepID=UPI00370D682C
MITDYKIRKTKNIRGDDNGVLYFEYVKKLSQDYPAISLEGFNPNREQGYFDILMKLIYATGMDKRSNILGYYSEFEPLQDDNPILKHKGYWWLKKSLNKKYINLPWKKYPFLNNKKEFIIQVDKKLKMGGIAYLDIKNTDEIDELISSVSYKINRGFFFLIDKSKIDEFDIAINQADYSKCIDFILIQKGIVFILLGEEDFKISEIVAISNNGIIDKIVYNLEHNKEIKLTKVL